MARSSQRGTGRVIAAGWDDAGTGSDERAGSPSAPSTPPEHREAGSAPRRRRWWLLGGVAALLALVLVLPSVLAGERSPETEVRRFLQAILDADTDTVREHMAEPENGALDAALTEDVLRAASVRADRFTLEETVIDGDHAEVTATLGLGRRSEETTFSLTRHHEGLLGRTVWELDPVQLPVLRVLVPVSASSVLVNGIEVELPEGALGGQTLSVAEVHLALLPGIYQVSAPEAGPSVSAVMARASIPPVLGDWTTGPIDLSYELTEQGAAELGEQILDGVLAECASSTSPHPKGCPFAAPDELSEEGAWEITTVPEVRVLSGMVGIFEFHAVGGVAEFTVPARDGEDEVHRVPFEGSGMVVRDRDGRFTQGSFWEDDSPTAP